MVHMAEEDNTSMLELNDTFVMAVCNDKVIFT